jgi:hypothetical protein
MNKLIISIILLNILIQVNLLSQSVSSDNSEYLPDIDGIVKTKAEFDLYNSLMRFEVRNARFGAKGKINPFMSYRLELDLSDEGIMKMLDAFVRFTPVPKLDFYMGQRKIPFSTDYIRSPAENIFANRSFLAKYINDGMRDIGFYANYKFTGSVPVDIFAGAVNGTGNNNPQWIGKPNLVGRISAGPEKGIRVTGNIYHGEAVYKENLTLYGAELRYSNGDLLIESEYISRVWTDTASLRIHDVGLYIHSYYNIKINSKIIYLLTPTARWDIIGASVSGNDIEANRLTLGLNTGFEPKQFTTEIRLNFEKYFKSSLPLHTDKITVEFIAKF